MASNAFVVLVGVALCVISPLSGGLATPTIAPNKLLFDISSNKDICPVKKIIVDSRYVQHCDEGKLPTDDRTLKVDDPEEFLCLAVYDRIATLCYLDSLSSNGKRVIPDKISDFDARVAALMPDTPDKILAFCSKTKNPYPPKYEKTKKYAVQLNNAMANPLQCMKMCIESEGVFNALCSVIVAVEDISYGVAARSEKSPKEETKDIAEKSKKIVENTVKEEEAIKDSTVDKPKEAAIETEDRAKDARPKTGDEKKEANKKIKQSEPPTPLQPQHPQSALEITKPAVILPSAPPKKTLQKEKDKKNESPETAAKPPHARTDDVGGDKETGVQPPLAKDSPPVAENLPVTEEITSDARSKGTGNVGQSPDEPTNGEISEHTQDQEDQDVGEETSELDPPPISPNEQMEESPPMPSEKREFIPRMPSDDDTHFFGYFTVIGVICIAGYVGYHNKQKILAMVLEGRRSRGGRGRRRPSTANYRKLDCTLEEAVTSQCNSNVTHVIY